MLITYAVFVVLIQTCRK